MVIGIYNGIDISEDEYAQQKNDMINKTYHDEIYFYRETNESGRNEYYRFLEDIRKNTFEKIMIYEIKQLGLTLKELTSFIDELITLNVKFVCISPEINSDEYHWESLVIPLLYSLKDSQNLVISKRTKKSLDMIKEQLKLEGKKLGRPKKTQVLVENIRLNEQQIPQMEEVKIDDQMMAHKNESEDLAVTQTGAIPENEDMLNRDKIDENVDIPKDNL